MADVAYFLLVIGPPIVLAVVGVVLLLRERSAAAWFAAIGFGAAAISQIAASFVAQQYTDVLSSDGDFAAVAWRYQGWGWVTHYLGVAGAWLGVIGLLWYVVRKSSRGVV